jgi:acetyl esterase/lipase
MSDDILSRKPPPADQRLPYGTDPDQFVDLCLPRGDKAKKTPAPLVLNIHGGFWRAKYDLEYGGHLCAALAGRGLATANLEYRRVGNEGGAWPGTFEDIRSAFHFLMQRASQHNFDPTKVIAVGHSAGAQLALCLASHEPTLAGVVSLAGVIDLQKAYDLHLSSDAVVEFLRGKPAEVPDHYREADPMRLSIPRSRQFLIHGLDDDIVPPAFSQDYVAAKRKHHEKEDVTLVEIAHSDHFALVDPESVAWKEVMESVFKIAT